MNRTDWFPVEVDPVYEGKYEVSMVSWPWVTRTKWTEDAGWHVNADSIITTWRGLIKEIK